MWMLKYLFKAGSIPRWFIVIIPFIIVFLLMALTQYLVYFPVKNGTSMIWLLIIGLIVGIPLGYKFRLKKKRGVTLAIVVVIGFLLVPYASFIFGQMHILMKDEAMPEHWTVIEIRSTTDKIVWVNENDEEVIVFQGPKTIALHPGENEIHFGSINAPAGTYFSGKEYMSNIEVDMQIDLSQTDLPPENYSDEFEMMQQYETQGTNWQLNGAIISFTIQVGSKEATMSWGSDGMYYPGMGGPDMILDIIIGSDGRPEKVEPKFDAPPGISIELPEEHHDFEN
jgi:hypothetical protein